MDAHDFARIALGSVRLLNGILALLAPQFLASRIGIDADAAPGGLYVFRMFGIRTVLIGADLLLGTDRRRADALNQAPVIHASDTVAAAIAAASGKLPGRAGLAITGISAFNTLLALYARRGRAG